jgi:two-component system, chemotaxis family, CheB/CheR fusion protein
VKPKKAAPMAKKNSKTTKASHEKNSRTTPYVVALGASAGGLEALQQFFTYMPSNSGVAFVIIQHLSPDYKSMMVELIAKTTSMVVKRVEDGMLVEPNHVYIIPPKTQMTIFHGKLLLAPVDHGKGLLLPIDVFFKSLSDDQGERAIGVILSGTGSDGTRGVRAIKEVGGMVMVQDGGSAKFSGMPSSAIATGLADFILTPDQMPSALVRYIDHPYLKNLEADKPALLTEENQLDKLLDMLRSETRVDFSLYKPSTIVRRIERRMGIAQVVTIEEYIRYLMHSKAELKLLYKDLLISVTKFFRDAESFQLLKEKVIPEIFSTSNLHKQIRIWVAGCATGEEAYSLAIMCADYMEQNNLKRPVKIFATDIDKEALEHAARGIYPDSIVADLPDSRLRRFFSKEGSSYTVINQIRQMVVFANHNIISDPPFNRMDMVTCRNLLIYLKPALQQRILRVFSFALYPRGFLFLGSSETIGDMHDVFDTVSVRQKVFRHRGTVKPMITEGIELAPKQDSIIMKNLENLPVIFNKKPAESDRALEAITEKIMKERLPACLVIEANGTLVHTFGNPGLFLTTPPGKATLNALEMMPREVGLLISSAMQKIRKTKSAVTYRDVKYSRGEESIVIDLTIEPFSHPDDDRLIYLLFIENPYHAPSADYVAEDLHLDQKVSQRINDLELDLQLNKENLQATIEELETSNEELQATNEELLASNEELQSTNEELQSVNEELYTVNAEYQNKITELAELNTDMHNLISSTGIGKIFLDLSLRIRKFTPPINEIIDLLPHDEGRLITDFAHPFLKIISEEASGVMETESTADHLLKGSNEKCYLIRIVPYYSQQEEIDGIVAALIDLTDLIENKLQKKYC